MGDFFKWLYPGLGIKRWITVMVLSFALLLFSFSTIILGFNNIGYLGRFFFGEVLQFLGGYTFTVAIIIAILSLVSLVIATLRVNHAIIRFLVTSDDKLVDIMYNRRHLSRGPKLVVLGGGTGLSVLLRGLKNYTSNITAVVTVADDGGSSGRLRGEMGMLPPGDIRNCLIALSEAEPELEQLFQHRFKSGKGLEGHNFGNLFLAAFTEIVGFEQAVKESAKVLAVRGKVLPVTLENVTLQARLKDGSIVRGESKIENIHSPIDRISLIPSHAKAIKDTIQEINEADAIVLGPGSLYTSIIPNLLINDVIDAIKKSSAPVYYICNIMTQKGETQGYGAADHVAAIEKHTYPGIIDYIILNNKDISSRQKHLYLLENATTVKIDHKRLENKKVKILEGNLLGNTIQVRHNHDQVAKKILTNLLENHYTGKTLIDHILLERKLHEKGNKHH